MLTLLLSIAALAAPSCPTDAQRAQLGAFADHLAAADSPAEARREALDKLKQGRTAIDRAARIVHDADGIADARARLDRLEDSVRAARTQDEVAAPFRMDTQAMDCHYDTVEIVIIVIGFVLGIIPGVIFLLLFC